MMRLYKKHILLLFLFLISLVVTFRGGTRDTYNYKNVFENINSYDMTSISGFYLDSGMEIGYGYLSYIIYYFWGDYHWVFFSVSFLTLFCLYRLVVEFHIRYLYFILIYLTNYFFFMQQFMQIRQGLATVLVLYGSILFMKKSYKFAIILLASSIFFHQSAIAFLGFFLFYYFFKVFFERNVNNISLYLSLFVFLIFLFRSILYLIPTLFIRVEAYSESDYAQVLSPFRLTSLRFYILYFIFILIFYWFKKSKKDIPVETMNYLVFLMVSYTVGLAARIGFNDFAILSTRLSEVFLFTEIFILSIFFTIFRNKGSFVFLVFYIFVQIFIIGNQFDYLFEDYFKDII